MLKKLIITTLIILNIILIASSSPPVKNIENETTLTNKELCVLANTAAKKEDRSFIDPKSGDILGKLPRINECNMGYCVISEEIDKCGCILQTMRIIKDDAHILAVVWNPLYNKKTKLIVWVPIYVVKKSINTNVILTKKEK